MWLVKKTGCPHASIADTPTAENLVDHLARAGIEVEVALDSRGRDARGGTNGVTATHGGQPRPAEQEVRPVASHQRTDYERKNMTFSEGDLHAFASTIVGDLRDAGLDIDNPHKWAGIVVESLARMLPNDADARKGSSTGRP